MERRRISNTDLEVSPICLGTMTFGNPVRENDAVRLVHQAIDAGINFIDTANMYEGYNRFIGSPGGVAEEILGKGLKGKREKVIVTTKVGMVVGHGDDDKGLGRKHIMREIDKSLKRLRMNYVDFYLMHKPDPDTPLAESLKVFNRLIDEGKVRYYGVSSFSAAEIRQLLSICDQNNWRRPVLLQLPYSLLKRDIEEEELPLCKAEGIAVTPYQILQGGLLTGKYKRGQAPPKDSRKAEKPDWVWELDDKLFDRLESIEKLAAEAGVSMGTYALGWVLAQPGVVSAISGVKRFEQLETNITSAEWTFPLEHLAKVKQTLL